MLKLCLIHLLLMIFLMKNGNSLKRDDYISSIEELILNKQFVEDYLKRSLRLFSEKDYLYGKQENEFPCEIPIEEEKDDERSVHNLRPIDIQCVGAIGDSLTAALGAHALTPIGLFYENRGISWSIGGDQTYEKLITLPNILKKYNPELKGFSRKSSVIFLQGQNSSNNGLNVAKSGDRSYHMIDQARILHQRLSSNEYCNWEKDWKVITFFVGGNDLCIFCEDLNKHSPSNYTKYVGETLNYLHEHFPRTFVNLVLVLDVRGVKQLNDGGTVCRLFHQKTCPCAAFPDNQTEILLNQWIPKYHQNLLHLVNNGTYDTRKDFTVVVQPFMAHTKIPRHADGTIDYSYFAPDCFHFSGKGHSRAALSLWNNMLQPIQRKQWQWDEDEQLLCPTKERPFFATRLNSI